MAFGKNKEGEELRLNLSPMIDCTFLILIYFIVSMQMEPSLDDIIKLPPVLKASKQEDALLQIYILPAKINKDGYVIADSTGLIAFSDKAKTPQYCPTCNAPLLDENGTYIPGALTTVDRVSIDDLQKAMAAAFSDEAPPPVFICTNCGNEVGPYVKLRDVPMELRKKKKEVVELMARSRNVQRAKSGLGPLTEDEKEALKDSVALMIKADNHTFYGRILQVVNMAKDTTAGIKNFAFVTDPTTSAEAKAAMDEQGGE
jgi:biopolymer transport protein ExbD